MRFLVIRHILKKYRLNQGHRKQLCRLKNSSISSPRYICRSTSLPSLTHRSFIFIKTSRSWDKIDSYQKNKTTPLGQFWQCPNSVPLAVSPLLAAPHFVVVPSSLANRHRYRRRCLLNSASRQPWECPTRCEKKKRKRNGKKTKKTITKQGKRVFCSRRT